MDQNNFQTDDVYSISVKHTKDATLSTNSRAMANDHEIESHYMPYEQSNPVSSNYAPNNASNSGGNGASSVSGMQHSKIVWAVVTLLLILSTMLSIVSLVLNIQMKQEQTILAQTQKLSYNDLKSQISEESVAAATVAKNTKENMESIERKLLNVKNNLMNESKALSFKIERITSLVTPSSCRDTRKTLTKASNETGGVFTIISPLMENPTEVFCDMATDGGGWIVFQRRMNGNVDFNRTWTDYVNGFGDKQGDFWLGLETIHKFTKYGNYELRIDAILDNNPTANAHMNYRSFSLGDSSTKYELSANSPDGRYLSSYGLNINVKKKFSAKDEDNDEDPRNHCAQDYGGFWYGQCGNTRLNSRFEEIKWWYDKIRFTEMKFRQQLN